jgi:hypothetical protein
MAISEGTLKPFFPEQERFLRAIKGEESPEHEVVVKRFSRLADIL